MKLHHLLPCALLLGLSACRTDGNEVLAQNTNDPVTAPPDSAAAPAPTGARKILLGLLLDTSNSMDGLIDQAKAQLWSIVAKLGDARCEGQRPSVQVALYEYGNDGLPERGNYIRQVMGFTTNMDEVSKALFALTTNGGNEYCGAVIARSVDDLDWGGSDADMRMLVIAGNEEFTQGPVDFTGACERARAKGIVVNTIFCGDHQEGVRSQWYAGAMAAKGSYFSIDHNAVTEQIASPYDAELVQLEQRWNAANIHYGKQGTYQKENMEAQDRNAGALGSSTSGKRREYKVKNSYLNRTWDLTEVEARSLDSVVRKVDRADLPEKYRSMDATALKQEVVRLQGEKQQLKDRIVLLNAQRDRYVAEQRKAQPGNSGLESSILAAIEKSAQAKGIRFEEAPVVTDEKKTDLPVN